MKTGTASRKRRAVYGKKIILFCSLLTAYCSLACSIPNLEKPECTEARQTVKGFYSLHFAGDMLFTPENLEPKKKFLTAELVNELPPGRSDKDPFTLTDDLPRAFRVGGCTVVEPDKRVALGVLLFWRTDTRTEEREINVEAVRQSDKWLINRISENNQK